MKPKFNYTFTRKSQTESQRIASRENWTQHQLAGIIGQLEALRRYGDVTNTLNIVVAISHLNSAKKYTKREQAKRIATRKAEKKNVRSL